MKTIVENKKVFISWEEAKTARKKEFAGINYGPVWKETIAFPNDWDPLDPKKSGGSEMKWNYRAVGIDGMLSFAQQNAVRNVSMPI